MRFPILVDLKEKHILIIGGGNVARRKGLALRRYCNNLTVVAPEIHPDLEFAKCIYGENPFEYLSKADLAIICTNNDILNKELAKECKRLKIWYLLASDEKNSEVTFPAVLDMGNLQICVSTNGVYPALSKKIKEDFIKSYGKFDSEYMENLREFRRIVLENNLDINLLYQVLDLDLEGLKKYIGRYK